MPVGVHVALEDVVLDAPPPQVEQAGLEGVDALADGVFPRHARLEGGLKRAAHAGLFAGDRPVELRDLLVQRPCGRIFGFELLGHPRIVGGELGAALPQAGDRLILERLGHGAAGRSQAALGAQPVGGGGGELAVEGRQLVGDQRPFRGAGALAGRRRRPGKIDDVLTRGIADQRSFGFVEAAAQLLKPLLEEGARVGGRLIAPLQRGLDEPVGPEVGDAD